jgi:uncharacterized protein
MSGPFEWDEDTAERNLRLHGVAFTEAVKVFDDTRAIEEYDAEHSSKDDARYTRIGLSGTRLLFVVFTVREERTRIIHARKADRIMEKLYAKQQTS